MNLEELFALVAEKWPCEEENYPGIDSLPDEKKKRFEGRHVIFHQLAELGRLADLYERQDHGAPTDVDTDHAARRMLVNAIKFAITQGLKADDMILLVQDWAHKGR